MPVNIFTDGSYRSTIKFAVSIHEMMLNGEECEVDNKRYVIKLRSGTTIIVSMSDPELQNLKLGERFEEPSEANDFIMTLESFKFDYLTEIINRESILYPGFTNGQILNRVAKTYEGFREISRPMNAEFINAFKAKLDAGPRDIGLLELQKMCMDNAEEIRKLKEAMKKIVDVVTEIVENV